MPLMGGSKGIIMGYFNTPLLATEKFGGLPPDLESCQHLANLIKDLALLDVELEVASSLGLTEELGLSASKLG